MKALLCIACFQDNAELLGDVIKVSVDGTLGTLIEITPEIIEGNANFIELKILNKTGEFLENLHKMELSLKNG